jgi:prepilin-type processing-associated H-X9-DG protein
MRGPPLSDPAGATPQDRAQRSYFINGWNDYFSSALGGGFATYMAGTYPQSGLKEVLVQKTSDTVIFGEKKNFQDPNPNNSYARDFYMDMLEGNGNDVDRIEHGCHSVSRHSARAGVSNFAFVDGSVRSLRYGASTWPLNLWAISDADRKTYAFIAP